MDKQMQDLIASARRSVPEIGELFDQHQHLDREVAELSERPHLTPEESLELIRLKKEKLKLRDALQSMLHQQQASA